MSSSKPLYKLELRLPSQAHRGIKSITEETRKAPSLRDESYTLDVQDSNPRAILTAKSSLGFFRGLQSFSQLVYTLPPSPEDDSYASTRQQQFGADPDSENRVRYLRAPVLVQDSPRFQYRGLLLDTSRNFFPISDLKRTINAMSWAKLNTFHWSVLPLVIIVSQRSKKKK